MAAQDDATIGIDDREAMAAVIKKFTAVDDDLRKLKETNQEKKAERDKISEELIKIFVEHRLTTAVIHGGTERLTLRRKSGIAKKLAKPVRKDIFGEVVESTSKPKKSSRKAVDWLTAVELVEMSLGASTPESRDLLSKLFPGSNVDDGESVDDVNSGEKLDDIKDPVKLAEYYARMNDPANFTLTRAPLKPRTSKKKPSSGD